MKKKEKSKRSLTNPNPTPSAPAPQAPPRLDPATFNNVPPFRRIHIAWLLIAAQLRYLSTFNYGRLILAASLIGAAIGLANLAGPLSLFQALISLALSFSAPIAYLHKSALSLKTLYTGLAVITVSMAGAYLPPVIIPRSPILAFILPVALAAVVVTIIGATVKFIATAGVALSPRA